MREGVDKNQIIESHTSQAEGLGMHRMANREPPSVLSRVRTPSLLYLIRIVLAEVGRAAWRLDQGGGIY